MQSIWWKILEMGLAAGWLVLILLAVRLVCRRVLPHNIRCVLWLLVAVRLVCPVMPESGVSLMPRGMELTVENAGKEADVVKGSLSIGAMEIEQGKGQEIYQTTSDGHIPATDESVVDGLDERWERREENRPAAGDTIRMPQENFFVMLIGWMRQYLPDWSWMVWLAGTVIMAGYGIYGCGLMRYLVRDAVPETSEDNTRKIWYSDRIQSPFILGIIRPRIYLPCKMTGEARECVVAHEQAHMIRCDPLTKLIGYALLSVYWFQPLVWAAYLLLCQDIEQACDERVIRSYGTDTRRKRCYMDVLLTVSTRGVIPAGGVLGFGEGHIRQRIRNLLRYKRPAAWTVGISALLCVAAAVVLLTDPPHVDALAANVTEPSEGPAPSYWEDAQEIPETGNVNLMALPMGQKVKVDLDGDGEKELLQITVNNQGEAAQLNEGDWRFAEAVIRVGQQNYDPEVFFDNLDLCTWYLFRVGGEIRGWQIGLYEDGPSADPNTHLFAYEEVQGMGQLVYLGALPDYPLNSIYHIYPGCDWQRGGQEPVDYDGRSYRDVLEQVDRSLGSWMKVPGDGSIYATHYMDILQSESVIGQWKLDGIRKNGLELQEQTQYEFWNGDNPYEEARHRTLEEIYVYTEPDTGAETAVIPSDQAVVFLTYDAESKWIRLGYNQGENTGYILADYPYASILLAPGPDDGSEPVSRIPGDIFSGLYLVP